MITYQIELTETEDKALAYVALSQQDWMDNAVHNRCRKAIDEIVNLAVQKYLELGESIPGDKTAIVNQAYERGWIETASQRNQNLADQLTANNIIIGEGQ
jgi:hypothetical protein